MKSLKIVLFLIFLCGIYLQLFSESPLDYQKACQYLDQMGEVYFKFNINSPEEIRQLTEIISLDKVNFDEVYAFANRQEFHEFLKYNLYYEVLTPPSLIGPEPKMSDYKDVTFPLFKWDEYPTYEGYLTIMEELESTYSDKVKVHEIGESVNGRKLLVANVSTNVGVRGCEPKFLLNAGIHGNELLPIMMVMRMIDWLCSNYEQDERATGILDSIDLWISPMLNPDGTYKGGNNTVFESIRYNARNVDLNRNYKRLPECGSSPTEEKETIAYVAFEKQHVFVMQIGWHSGTEGISFPWSCVSRQHADHDWYNYVSRQYADQAQEDSPSGYWTKINNGAGQGYHYLYPAVGTEKCSILYYRKCRSNCFEASMTKVLSESNLDAYWGYNKNAFLQYLQQVLNGIRGTVVDEVTKEGLPAKIWVEDHDKNADSSFVYADTSTAGGSGGYGNYNRPIIAGTYNVTYSCEGCDPKTVRDISVQNDKATIVNVELDCGSTGITNNYKKTRTQISIISISRGIKINYGNIKGIVKAAIYDVNGKLLKTLPIKPGVGSMVWNGLNNGSQQISSGCYIIQIQVAGMKFSQPFILTN